MASSRESQRGEMIQRQLIRRGINDQRVLDAMSQIPREQFIADACRDAAYGDHALEIDCQQTISQPYMVALMTAALELQGAERVLEIGTGSGYQTMLLSVLTAEVYTIERHAPLARQARQRLENLGADNVVIRCGDGTLGWSEAAPFDRILITAGGPSCPPPLQQQVGLDGILVGPFGGTDMQTLQQWRRTKDGWKITSLTSCRFVPLVEDHPAGNA